ncbi:GNAT family N-acetyltransferase [Paenibacillus sp. WLX1005]|uniref:GNAT family N-acetyltransferase n=1 Tax=Paenibacillus sp. WLX1005 TaxID=3243766 RepID=UPI003983DDBE
MGDFLSESKQRDPLLLSFPQQWTSERLLIRAPRPGDGAVVNEAIVESEVELAPWMTWAHPLPTVEQSETNARRGHINFLAREDLVLYIFNLQTGEFVGSSGLHRIDWELRSFELGYWVRSSQAGQGFITEAVHSISNFAIRYLHANRLEIRCDENNHASVAVARRAGFTLEAKLRNARRDQQGNLGNTMIFSKVHGVEYDRNEWAMEE